MDLLFQQVIIFFCLTSQHRDARCGQRGFQMRQGCGLARRWEPPPHAHQVTPVHP